MCGSMLARRSPSSGHDELVFTHRAGINAARDLRKRRGYEFIRLDYYDPQIWGAHAFYEKS